jgi:hypothetical protein
MVLSMPGRPEHRALLERIERAARAESAEARAMEWRNASDETRAEALAGLCILAWEAALASGYCKPALALVRLPRRTAAHG